jgi:DNA replication and repair protein RecF
MRVARLLLTQFRNHADALIAPGPGFVILTGENGAGKTNVLEAVSLLAPGRGLRGAALSEMARREGDGAFAVAAKLGGFPFRKWEGTKGWATAQDAAVDESPPPTPPACGRGEEIDIGTGTTPAAPERRQVRINGAAASATSLAEWLSVLWLTPAMDRLFSEAASGRRRFLDRLVLAFEPGHATHAARYEAAMRARNKLLADPASPDPAWLTALEAAMAEHGAALGQARERTLAALAQRLAEQPEGPFARASAALEHWHPDPADPEGALRDALRRGRPADAGAGRALIGPHRSDLAVVHAGKGVPAGRCSTGEQKALLLGLVLAHAGLVAERVGRPPILLLDEVAAHLDPTRRLALFERLLGAGGQVWMTGTEPALFDGIAADATRLVVADGQLLQSS